MTLEGLPLNRRWNSVPARRVLLERQDAVREDDEIVTCFRDGQVTLRRNRREEGFTNAIQEHGYKSVEPGDLVVHSMDAFAGAIGVSDSRGKMSPVVGIYQAPLGDARFYAYYLRACAYSGYIESLAKGIRERSTSFDRQSLASLHLPDVPVVEQRRIADFLDDQVARIDELKAVRQQQYELTKEGFTSWLDAQTEEMPLVPLRRLASSITSGPRGWGDLVSDEGDRMFIRINNISAAGIGMNLDDVAWVTPEENAESRRAQLEEGDLLVSITASIGDVSTVDSLVAGSAFSQHVARVRLVDPSRGRDVAWAASTRASRERLRALSFGGTKVGLGLQDVLDWEIPLVPDDAARTFSALTDERFELITNASTALETGLALLEERKRSLITTAVAGELDVTTAKPIGMGKWVPNVRASVEAPATAQASSIGGIG